MSGLGTPVAQAGRAFRGVAGTEEEDERRLVSSVSYGMRSSAYMRRRAYQHGICCMIIAA